MVRREFILRSNCEQGKGLTGRSPCGPGANALARLRGTPCAAPEGRHVEGGPPAPACPLVGGLGPAARVRPPAPWLPAGVGRLWPFDPGHQAGPPICGGFRQ